MAHPMWTVIFVFSGERTPSTCIEFIDGHRPETWREAYDRVQSALKASGLEALDFAFDDPRLNDILLLPGAQMVVARDNPAFPAPVDPSQVFVEVYIHVLKQQVADVDTAAVDKVLASDVAETLDVAQIPHEYVGVEDSWETDAHAVHQVVIQTSASLPAIKGALVMDGFRVTGGRYRSRPTAQVS